MASHNTRHRFLSGAAAVVLAGCLGQRNSGTPTTGSARDSVGRDEPAQATTASESDGALPPTAKEPLPVSYSFDELRDGVRSGGPPKDGIPSIADPTFVSVSDAPNG